MYVIWLIYYILFICRALQGLDNKNSDGNGNENTPDEESEEEQTYRYYTLHTRIYILLLS